MRLHPSAASGYVSPCSLHGLWRQPRGLFSFLSICDGGGALFPLVWLGTDKARPAAPANLSVWERKGARDPDRPSVGCFPDAIQSTDRGQQTDSLAFRVAITLTTYFSPPPQWHYTYNMEWSGGMRTLQSPSDSGGHLPHSRPITPPAAVRCAALRYIALH